MTGNTQASWDWNGRGYVLPRLIRADKTRWHIWCNAFARKQIAMDRQAVEWGWLEYGEFLSRAKETQDRLDTGYYHYDEEGGRAFLRTDQTFLALVWICMQRVDPGLTQEQVAAMSAGIGSRQLVLYWQEANADPFEDPASAGAFQSKTTGQNRESSAPSSATA